MDDISDYAEILLIDNMLVDNILVDRRRVAK